MGVDTMDRPPWSAAYHTTPPPSNPLSTSKLPAPEGMDEVAVNITVAEANFDGSATLVAVTVTFCAAAIEEGAVYRPVEEMVPTLGDKDQFTAVLVVPATVAVNCCVCDADKLELNGVIPKLTVGTRVTVAVADFNGSATLLANTVMVCGMVIKAGAV